MSRCERGIRPSRSSAGGTPVIEWGVRRYLKRNLTTLVGMEPSSFFSMLRLKDWTARSANPLVAGWYGAERKWRIPFLSMKALNSALVNCAPLSDMNTSGK